MSYSYSEIEKSKAFLLCDKTDYPVEDGTLSIKNQILKPTDCSDRNREIIDLKYFRKIGPITISPEQEIYKHRAKELVKKATAKLTEVRQYLLKQAGIMVEGQFNQRLPEICWKEIKSYLEDNHPFKRVEDHRFPLYKYYQSIRWLPERRDGAKGKYTGLVVLQMPVLLCRTNAYDVDYYLKDVNGSKYVWVRMMWKRLLLTTEHKKEGRKLVEKRLMVQLQPLSIAEACLGMGLPSKGAIELQNKQPFNTVIQLFAYQQPKEYDRNIFVKWGFKKISQTSVESVISGSYTPDRTDIYRNDDGDIVKKDLVKFKTNIPYQCRKGNYQCVLVPHTMNYRCILTNKPKDIISCFCSSGDTYTAFKLHTEYLNLNIKWDWDNHRSSDEWDFNTSSNRINGFDNGEWYSYDCYNDDMSGLDMEKVKLMENYVIKRGTTVRLVSHSYPCVEQEERTPADNKPFNRYFNYNGYVRKMSSAGDAEDILRDIYS
jgi:hypothetical protein